MRGSDGAPPSPKRASAAHAPAVRRPWLAVLAVAAVAPLGAAQLWPTLRLARLAATQRDYEYLSGFASTPLHLISYVAPRLFHGSALWRPLAWDPFHTSPEEHLAYVGLVPLFLARRAVSCAWRHDQRVRVLTALAVFTLVLSLGPYVPGFALWSRLPGFSFFRAPARWSLGTALALALLAARGFGHLPDLERPTRSLLRFAMLASLAIAVVVGAVEAALRATEARAWPSAAGALSHVFRVWPWAERPDIHALGRLARTTQPQLLLNYAREEAREGRAIDLFRATPRFVTERHRIYARELGETAVLLVAVVVLGTCVQRHSHCAAGLAAVALLDLWALGRHRPVDTAPIRPLTDQSTVLAGLAAAPRGTRVAGPGRNLPMVARAAPLQAYRTLDLPALPRLTGLADTPDDGFEPRAARRATGVAVRVFGPFTRRPGGVDRGTVVADPALASWLFGADVVATQGAWLTRFVVARAEDAPGRAWVLPLTADTHRRILEVPDRDVGAVLRLFARARSLECRSTQPGQWQITVEGGERDVVVVSQLFDPQWRAVWIGPRGTRRGTIRPAFPAPGQGGWQTIAVPEPGRWTLRLEYDARDVRQGLTVSGVSWLALLGVMARFGCAPKPPCNEGQTQ